MIAVESRIEASRPPSGCCSGTQIRQHTHDSQSLYAPQAHMSKTRPLRVGKMQLREVALHLP